MERHGRRREFARSLTSERWVRRRCVVGLCPLLRRRGRVEHRGPVQEVFSPDGSRRANKIQHRPEAIPPPAENERHDRSQLKCARHQLWSGHDPFSENRQEQRSCWETQQDAGRSWRKVATGGRKMVRHGLELTKLQGGIPRKRVKRSRTESGRHWRQIEPCCIQEV